MWFLDKESMHLMMKYVRILVENIQKIINVKHHVEEVSSEVSVQTN